MEFLINLMPLATSNSANQQMIGQLVGLLGYLLTFAVMGAMVLVYLAIVGSIALVAYIIVQIPIYKMARNAGLPKAWLAFVPLAGTYVTVCLAKKPFDIFNGKFVWDRKKAAKIFIIAIAVDWVLVIFGGICSSVIPIIGFLLFMVVWVANLAFAVAAVIFRVYVNMDIIDTYTPNDENRTLWVVLSVVVPIAYIVWLFIHMNDRPNYEYVEYKKNVAARQQQS